MTDRAAIAQWFALQDVEISTEQRQDIENYANDHWSISSRTLESWRLFVFSWIVSRVKKEDRWAAWKLITDAINIEPFMNTPYLHDLFFQTDEGEERQVKAMVKEKPRGTNWIWNPVINFSFELFAPWNAIYGITEHTAIGESSVFWWTSFANSFPIWWGWYSWATSCENLGNYKAWCEIKVVGELTNPLIKNLTTWQQFKINWVTKNLILNSKDWRTVEDEWVDIKYKREYGSAILLWAWMNQIWVFADAWDAAVTVKRFDAWNTI